MHVYPGLSPAWCQCESREPLLVVDSSAIVAKYDLIARLDYNMQM